MNFLQNNCSCDNCSGVSPSGNLVYLTKVFYDNQESASPILANISNQQCKFVQELTIGNNVCENAERNGNSSCGCGCGCGCGNTWFTELWMRPLLQFRAFSERDFWRNQRFRNSSLLQIGSFRSVNRRQSYRRRNRNYRHRKERKPVYRRSQRCNAWNYQMPLQIPLRKHMSR